MRKSGSPGRTRTSDKAVNSRLLYQLSYRGTVSIKTTERYLAEPPLFAKRFQQLFLMLWRPGPESNRCTRLCRPLHDHSATRPRFREEPCT